MRPVGAGAATPGPAMRFRTAAGRRGRRWVPFLVLWLPAITGCGGGDAQRAAASSENGPAKSLMLGSADVETVRRWHLDAGVPVSGTLAPAQDVRITAPAPELLEAVLVKEGQRVSRGQVLARFRTSALGPAASSAEAQRKIAAADLVRMKNLLAQGAVSPQDVEKADAALKGAEAVAALAEKRLDEATVRAPFAGVIAERQVQSGDRVGDGDPLFRIVNTSELEFEATMPSEFAGRVRPGAPALLSVSGQPGVPVRGRVARVNATADPATRQVKLYLAVANPDGRLVGDLFATGRVVLASANDAAAVATAAVKRDGQGPFVWLVQGGRLVRRGVAPGLVDEVQDRVEIRSGLEGGETVVVGPVEGLAPGLTVQLQGGTAGAASAPDSSRD
jgi:membrane fusion protein (multidrug efflux system)